MFPGAYKCSPMPFYHMWCTRHTQPELRISLEENTQVAESRQLVLFGTRSCQSGLCSVVYIPFFFTLDSRGVGNLHLEQSLRHNATVVRFRCKITYLLNSRGASAADFTGVARMFVWFNPRCSHQLSDGFGELLAQSLSSPLCALTDLILADNFFSDRFTDALSKGMRNLKILSLSPLKNLDVSNNKICDRLDNKSIPATRSIFETTQPHRCTGVGFCYARYSPHATI